MWSRSDRDRASSASIGGPVADQSPIRVIGDDNPIRLSRPGRRFLWRLHDPKSGPSRGQGPIGRSSFFRAEWSRPRTRPRDHGIFDLHGWIHVQLVSVTRTSVSPLGMMLGGGTGGRPRLNHAA
jgi:hypothetical protein